MKWLTVTAEESDRAFGEDALIAEFENDAEESAYEKLDSFLIALIKRKCEEVLGDNAATHTHHVEDWWPNHTRYVYVSIAHCSRELILALHSLLSEEFENYRIQLLADSDLSAEESTQIGAMVIYADRILVESDVAVQLPS